MNYRRVAEELLTVQAELLHVPVNRMMERYVRGEIFVLDFLMAHNGTVFPKDLSRGLDVSSARIAALSNQIEKKGWITRTSDAEDSRQTVITLTDVGRREVERVREEVVDAVAQVLERIGSEDAEALLRIKRKIIAL